MGNSDNVKSMQHSASHIMSMLENLLEFSSIEQGKLKKYESSFSLHELSEEIYGMMRPLAERKNLNLDFESDEVAVATDQIKIKQLLINLVSNAIKYTSDGDVFFELKYAGNSLHLIVEDTGAGIPEDKISDLFKPFTRIEQNNSLAKGSGLGLFVVKGIVDLLDGKIEYFSQVGEGTKVEVVLPVALAEKESEKKTLRVKVYDDDEVVLKVVSDMISSLGHLIVTDNPDIIITDMEMGDISGLDILKGAGDVPVVIMTGKADYSREQALLDGFVDYIPKPVTVALLRNIIGEGERFEDSMGTDYKDVVKLFRTSIKDDLARLHKAFDDDDYFAARAICHKMLPMFIQLGYKTDELTRMDLNKNNSYPDWKKDVETILSVKID